MEEARIESIPIGERFKGLLLNWRLWAWLIGAIIVIVFVAIAGKREAGNTLGGAVDLFKCCIFTLNAVTIVFPAFLIAGAVVTFLPTQSVMKYLGAKANRFLSYGVSSISGNILTVCSCNVVPIFSGILRRGAGIGPAFCFVYAAPAIHIVNTIFTYQVIGPRLAIWRFIMVPIIAIITGLMMAFIFRKEERARQAHLESKAQVALVSGGGEGRKGLLFVGAIAATMIFGAWYGFDKFFIPGVGQYLRLGIVIVALVAITILGFKWFGSEEAKEWWRQSYEQIKTIIPISVPAILVIAIVVQHIPFDWIAPTQGQIAARHGFAFGHPQGNHLLPVLASAMFGTLMYFPALTEVAFVKGLLLEHFAVGPALAVLLGGPGLSLPGLLLIARLAGWKKAVAYWVITVSLITLAAWWFGVKYGPYLCSCQLTKAAGQ